MQRSLFDCGLVKVDDPKESVAFKGLKLHPQVLLNRAQRLQMEREEAEKADVHKRYQGWREKNPHFGKCLYC